MLFVPFIKLDSITEITVELLERHGIKALVLDVDNTLSTHHGQRLTNGLRKWLDDMHKAEVKLLLLSNSKDKRVAPFAKKIGLDYISMGLKPLPFGFSRAIKKLGTKKSETAVVGDQIFTDTLGGNAFGIKTILLTPIKLESSLRFRFKRRIERLVIAHYKIEKTEEQ